MTGFTQTDERETQSDGRYTREDMRKLAQVFYCAAQYRGKLTAYEKASPLMERTIDNKFEQYMNQRYD